MPLKIYTDGSGTTHENPGGWAYVIVKDGQEIVRGSGGQQNATNNQMELMAAIQGLAAAGPLKEEGEILLLVSDSEYVVNLANGTYDAKKNLGLARALSIGMSIFGAHAMWTKAHSGDQWNELADYLAGMERQKLLCYNE